MLGPLGFDGLVKGSADGGVEAGGWVGPIGRAFRPPAGSPFRVPSAAPPIDGRAVEGRSPFPVPAAPSEPGAKPGCSPRGLRPFAPSPLVGVGVPVSAPIAGVEVAADGAAPTEGIVVGVCEPRPVAPRPFAEAGAAAAGSDEPVPVRAGVGEAGATKA